MTGPFITRVTLRNYKSIASCKIDLPRLAFLIGPNGSGKSNFLDSFRFVADSLKTSLDHALRDRGTIKEVRRRSGGHPNHFSIRLDFNLPDSTVGHLSFRVGARRDGGFEAALGMPVNKWRYEGAFLPHPLGSRREEFVGAATGGTARPLVSGGVTG